MVDSQLNDILRSISRGDAEFLPSVVEAMALATKADAVLVSRVNGDKHVASTLAFYLDGQLVENFEYSLSETPCEEVFINPGKSCVYNNDVQHQFPNDKDLVDLGVRSYFGYPLKNDTGELLGILVALYRKNIDNLDRLESLFGLFSGIVSRELTIIEKNKHLSLASSVIENAQEAVLVFNSKREIKFANRAFERVTGYLEEEVLDTVIDEDNFYPDPEKIIPLIMTAVVEHGSWQGELQSQRKNGEHYIQWLQVNRDPHGFFIWQFSDISSKENASKAIHFQANFDGLTLLPNRHLFEDRLNQAVRSHNRYGKSFAVMFMDLDGFKIINDQYGHVVGDKLLKQVAQRLKIRLRASDTVARYGGDEFVFLLDPNSSDSSDEVAESICDVIAQPFEIDGKKMSVSASIGVAHYPSNGSNLETLVRNADTAMYVAKKLGKNRYQTFLPPPQKVRSPKS